MVERDTPELWGGLECTVVRIGDEFRDQSVETGHSDRIEDLDVIAALGIRTLRYPVLWETISPDRADKAEWCWHDARLQRLRDLGLSETEIMDVVLAAAARCFFSKTLDALGVLPDASFRELEPELRDVLVVGRPIADA